MISAICVVYSQTLSNCDKSSEDVSWCHSRLVIFFYYDCSLELAFLKIKKKSFSGIIVLYLYGGPWIDNACFEMREREREIKVFFKILSSDSQWKFSWLLNIEGYF